MLTDDYPMSAPTQKDKDKEIKKNSSCMLWEEDVARIE